MAYFKTFTATFVDIHNTMPATWRMDIYDDQANAGVVPYEFQLGPDPLIIERIGTSDDKNDLIIGEQITIQYVIQDGLPDPLPTLFFDADERRFQVQLFKNGNLYGVYYVKPDGGRYPYKHPPYTVSITAVDGLAFLKGTIWNAYTPAGLLDYRWMTLYEILIERGLFLIMDDSMEVNLISSLKPENMVSAGILNNLWIHSDMFIDFAKGPDDVYTVLQKVLNDIYCRLILSENKIWLIRIPDLMQSNITAENYIHGVYNPLLLQTAVRSIGPDESTYNAIPVKASAYNLIFPALKKIEKTVKYRAINQLLNFDWRDFDGNNFSNWPKSIHGANPKRSGTGTEDDPYRAKLLYINDPDSFISQNLPGVFSFGQPINFDLKYSFTNTKYFRIIIYADPGVGQPFFFLNQDGTWFQNANGTDGIPVTRSAKVREGSMSIKSLPIPASAGTSIQIGIRIYYPTELTYHTPPQDGDFKDDPSALDSVEIYPIKLGATTLTPPGRHLIDTNQGRYSKTLADSEFYFIDTGDKNASNTISMDNTGTPANNWTTTLLSALAVQHHMANSMLDQYAHSIYGWEGTLKSNNIQFWNIFTLFNVIGKRLVAMKDRYNVRSCQHEIGFQEILPDGAATTTYLETDIDSNS